MSEKRATRLAGALAGVLCTALLLACGHGPEPVRGPSPGADLERDRPIRAVLVDPAYSITEAAKTPRDSYFPSPGDWRDEVIYHLLTDRWYNGDPDNDNDHPRGTIDRAHADRIHGGDFAGLKEKLPYLEELGVSAVWISPVVLNTHGQYHGYHALDFGRIDPHWGTLAELQDFIDEAHKRDIRVFIDVVCNHMSYLIETVGEGAPAFLPPPDEYELRWRNSNVRYNPPFDNLELFHAHGNLDWNYPESLVLGELFGLNDLKTELPEVRKEMIRFYSDLITATDCDGFRVDTTKHVEPDFWYEWCPAIKEHAASLGKDDFMIFGEVWDYDIPFLNEFLVQPDGSPAYDSLLDFPRLPVLQDVFARATSGTLELSEINYQLQTNLAEHARGRLVRFLDNHDGKRFLAIAKGSQPDKVKLHNRLKLALVYLMTTGGTPIIYYGTEQGFSGAEGRGWSDSREDMFDGLFEAGPSLGDNFDTTSELFQFTKRLLESRKARESFRHGFPRFVAAGDKPGLLAYELNSPNDRTLVILNTSEQDAVSIKDLLYEAAFYRGGAGRTARMPWRVVDGWETEAGNALETGALKPQGILILEREQ
ncbi:hypothetical protein KQI84_09590 [bacterium]|nr:hypothetical protein [bacterium]